MKIVRETSKNLICRCPSGNHQDKNPSFYILKIDYKGHTKGFGYCWSCGHIAKYSPEWVDKMSKKKTKRFREKQPINWIELSFKYFLKREKELLNFSKSICDIYRVGWDGEAWTLPMYDIKGIIGIQRRFPDGSKSCVEGSQLGLFIPGPISYQDTKKIVITEGSTDAATATECGFYGIGYPSASFGQGLIVKFLIYHAINTITIISDNDEPGRKSSEKIAELCEQKCIGNRIVSVKPHKDLREYYENKGKERTKNLLS